MSGYSNEPMLDMFVFETTQLLEQLEQIIINNDKSGCYDQDAINEIFRIMHTIKGSSSMMSFDNISTLTHSVEDLFNYLREKKPLNVDYSKLSDIVLESVDFIKAEMQKIENGVSPDGDSSRLIEKIKGLLAAHKKFDDKADTRAAEEHPEQSEHPGKRSFKAVIYYEEGCEMESIRAFTLIHNLKDIAGEISYIPAKIIDNDNSDEIIRKEGFQIWFTTDLSYEEMHNFFSQTIFLKDLELVELENNKENIRIIAETEEKGPERDNRATASHHNIISVNVTKLDMLMDLVGELVISEAMVIQNPDLAGLTLNNFQKAARQHGKIIDELQDIAMSIRMVPLSSTFQKLNRIVRDMSKKLEKNIELKIIGEETEVDKNIIEHISDPLMHLVRNAIDHGIESPEDRLAKGKPETGTITLEAKNAGSDVLIIVKDDGKGLNKEKILKKARDNGLLYKPEEEMSDKEVFNLIFLPGFSTKESVTEFSGRGVGMDVVMKNIETIGGSVSVDSTPDRGSTITLKIPLTLAIIDGMNIRVGSSRYTIPTTSIRESFRPKENDVFSDPDGNEMIMVRGQCYPILRLHELFKVKTGMTDFIDGIITMTEQDDKTICIFADELLGQQQVVVKALPEYIKRFKKTKGFAGCTLLSDGSISLILDIAGLNSL